MKGQKSGKIQKKNQTLNLVKGNPNFFQKWNLVQVLIYTATVVKTRFSFFVLYVLKVAFFQKVRFVFQISKKVYSKSLSRAWNLNTVFPWIVSAETILFLNLEIGSNLNSCRNISISYLINWIFAAETIQRQKSFMEIR